MTFTVPWYYLHIILGLGTIYLFYHIYWDLTVGAARRRLIKQHGCKPIKRPPMIDPFLGIDFIRDFSKQMKEQRVLEGTQGRFKALGTGTYRFSLLGTTIIPTMEPDNVRSILSLDFKSYSLGEVRKGGMVSLLGKGIFTTDGAAWQHSREMLRPMFNRSQLLEDLEMFERHADHLIEAIPKDSSTVDLQELFFQFTLDLATELLFGNSTNCLLPSTETNKSVQFVDAFNDCQNLGNDSIWSIFMPNRKFKRNCRIVHEFAEHLISQALSRKERSTEETDAVPKRVTFLDQLIAETTDKVRIRSELLNLLLAGRDSTAALMSNVFFELSRRPEIQDRLRREVATHIGDELPTFEGIKIMKYLRAILNESLRIHPIVPENSRQAVCDTVLPLGGGEDGRSPALVKKGQLVAWSSYAMHRREDFYGEDAAEFKPERWLDDLDGDGGKGLRVGWEYLPFNGGPRICIGQQFALLESSYVIIRILQSFSEIQSRDSKPWREKLTLTCTSYGGCQVVLTPRT